VEVLRVDFQNRVRLQLLGKKGGTIWRKGCLVLIVLFHLCTA
jgi:hypothetical protein